MGLMSDHYTATYDGHSIEVEGRVTSIMGSAEYSLVVDNQRVDQIQGSLGRFVLRTGESITVGDWVASCRQTGSRLGESASY